MRITMKKTLKKGKLTGRGKTQKGGNIRFSKAEEGMNMVKRSNFRNAFVESLLEKKRELENLLENLVGSQKEYNSYLTAGDFIDQLDDAQREISSQSHFTLIERKIREIQKIDYLIHRVHKDEEFGLCEECGKPIPKERLLIVPEATLCVPCQMELEKWDSIKNLSSKTPVDFTSEKGMDWGMEEDEEEKGPEIKQDEVDNISLSDMNETEIDDTFKDTEG